MNTMTSTIRFYFDYESPNAYLAWTQLPKLAERYGFTIDPVPILYAALLDAHGQLGPGEQPTKGRWMSKNILRKALLFGVPSMMVGDELFWGYDDFPYLELFLAGKDPLDTVELQKWN